MRRDRVRMQLKNGTAGLTKKFFWIYLAIVFGTGIFFRIAEYQQHRSFWFDEAVIAERMGRCSFSDMCIGKTDSSCLLRYPPVFLYLEKSIAQRGGVNEFTLRLLPLLAGCLAVGLFYLLSRRILSVPFAAVAALVFAVSPTMIFYSSEAKPYMGDVAVSLVILLAYVYLLRPSLSAMKSSALFIGAAAVPYLSFPSMFVLIGAGLGAGIYFLGSHDRKPAVKYFIFCGMAFAGVLSYCFFVLRGFHAESKLYEFWHVGFLTWVNAQSVLRSFAETVLYLKFEIFFILFVAGLSFLIWENTVMGPLLWGPLVAAIIASSFRIYPLWERSAIFLMPIALIVVMKGIEGAFYSGGRRLHGLCRWVAVVFSGIILWSSASVTWQQFRHPYSLEEVRPAVEYLKNHRKPDEVIYVYYGARKAFHYYASQYGLPTDGCRISVSARFDPGVYVREIAAVAQGRVWFVGTHFFHEDYAVFLNEFLSRCTEIDQMIYRTCSSCPCPSLNKTEGIASVLHLFDCGKNSL